MARKTPFHPRTEALCTSYAWKEWAGYHAVCNYDRHSEREYYAIRHSAGLLDVTPLYKYEVRGPDAGALLARVWTRDVSNISVGRVVYSAMADERGKCVDDGTVARLSADHYRMTSSEPWLGWLHRFARRLDVTIEDSTDRIAALALQGPAARAILAPLVSFDLGRMRFFRVRSMQLAGRRVWVSRTGYTGDLGYEVWCDNGDALAVWDAITEEGRIHGLEAIGLDALDVARIEAGFVLQGVDYVSARRCLTERLKSTPEEAGLGWTVDLEREPFVGQAALRRERSTGARWALIGLDVSWPGLEALYDSYGLPPHLAPHASRAAIPIYDAAGTTQVGQATSTTWSPVLKKMLAIGQVYAGHGKVGTRLKIEHTPEFARKQVDAVVVERPFFDPDRKRSTPGAAPPATTEVSAA